MIFFSSIRRKKMDLRRELNPRFTKYPFRETTVDISTYSALCDTLGSDNIRTVVTDNFNVIRDTLLQIYANLKNWNDNVVGIHMHTCTNTDQITLTVTSRCDSIVMKLRSLTQLPESLKDFLNNPAYAKIAARATAIQVFIQKMYNIVISNIVEVTSLNDKPIKTGEFMRIAAEIPSPGIMFPTTNVPVNGTIPDDVVVYGVLMSAISKMIGMKYAHTSNIFPRVDWVEESESKQPKGYWKCKICTSMIQLSSEGCNQHMSDFSCFIKRLTIVQDSIANHNLKK